jgi:hypothetical protein
VNRVARHVGLALTFLFLATAGGRITASDEYTMYRLTESLVTRGAVWVEAGNAERGPDGRLYPKAGIGQALAAAPFFALGKAAAIPFSPAKKELVTRAVTSLLNAFASGLLGAILFLLFLEVGAAPRGALFWACATCLATPLWVYAKSFLTEPLLALGLTAGFYGALRFRATGAPRHAMLAGLRGRTVLVKYALAPAVLLLALLFLPDLRRTRAALPGVLAVLLCVLLALVYNATRTGSPLGTGYGRQATASAFSTPLFVGLYGLLLSSGKGILWYAPLVVLVPAAVPAAVRRLGAPAWGIVLALCAMTLVYASFEHWAGDGSWGPRYLVPLVPLALTLVVAAHAQEPWGAWRARSSARWPCWESWSRSAASASTSARRCARPATTRTRARSTIPRSWRRVTSTRGACRSPRTGGCSGATRSCSPGARARISRPAPPPSPRATSPRRRRPSTGSRASRANDSPSRRARCRA